MLYEEGQTITKRNHWSLQTHGIGHLSLLEMIPPELSHKLLEYVPEKIAAIKVVSRQIFLLPGFLIRTNEHMAVQEPAGETHYMLGDDWWSISPEEYRTKRDQHAT